MYQSDSKWSYTRISNIKALSQLPDAVAARAEQGIVYDDWVIDETLKDMKGLEKGGVNWGRASTGCFVRGEAGSELST